MRFGVARAYSGESCAGFGEMLRKVHLFSNNRVVKARGDVVLLDNGGSDVTRELPSLCWWLAWGDVEVYSRITHHPWNDWMRDLSNLRKLEYSRIWVLVYQFSERLRRVGEKLVGSTVWHWKDYSPDSLAKIVFLNNQPHNHIFSSGAKITLLLQTPVLQCMSNLSYTQAKPKPSLLDKSET